MSSFLAVGSHHLTTSRDSASSGTSARMIPPVWALDTTSPRRTPRAAYPLSATRLTSAHAPSPSPPSSSASICRTAGEARQHDSIASIRTTIPASTLHLRLSSPAGDAALLFYDYFLTFEWEVSRYWARPNLSWATIFFFLNRYGTLLGNIPVVIQYFWTTPSTPQKTAMYGLCILLESYHPYLILVIQMIVGVMLILRTYALYKRSNRILAFMLVFGVTVACVCLGTTLFSNKGAGLSGDLGLYIGCTYAITARQSMSPIIAWSAMALFDCMIFSLTLYKAFGWHLTGLNLFTVLLRDGSIYFGVIVILNLSNILTFVLGGDYTRGVATTLTNIVSSLMISRLMLNLRDPSLATNPEAEGVGEFSTHLNFNHRVEPPRSSNLNV
ncbi:hypothetical protein B0H19DRAFT_1385540 [Mycena capillaripes]|nr:hypothetical protein B0H19DRAFT_1385540 [Mycena capillaripes]